MCGLASKRKSNLVYCMKLELFHDPISSHVSMKTSINNIILTVRML